ncbi:MAG: hypothetical protein LBO77_06375 [Desulfovibrio sp.]|jgi:hypothetical protein|nr:hypothetical protein [Desulfovibrio sp.]
MSNIDSAGAANAANAATQVDPGGSGQALQAEVLVVDEMFRAGLRTLYGDHENGNDVSGIDDELAGLYTQMAKQTQKLQDFNEMQQDLNTLLAKERASETILATDTQRLAELATKYPELGIKTTPANGVFFIYGTVNIANLETWQKNVSAQQSSLGAVNEELTLTLNQKASERSAVFTQLQTLLQTMMQLRASLARW